MFKYIDYEAFRHNSVIQHTKRQAEDYLRLGAQEEDGHYYVPNPNRATTESITEEVVPFTKQWAPSDIELKKIWQIAQVLIKKGLGDQLNWKFDNFLYAIEQYNEMKPNSELASLDERHLHQIYEYGKKLHWQPLSREGFKARQRMIAKSWGKEVTEGIMEAPVRDFNVGDLSCEECDHWKFKLSRRIKEAGLECTDEYCSLLMEAEMTEHQWAIIDDVGIIKQGSEEEMRAIWEDPDQFYMRQEIVGDLRLIEIHEVIK